MIRRAVLTDLPEVVELSKMFFAEMRFSERGGKLDIDVIVEGYSRAIAEPDKLIFLVSENGGKVDGVMCVAIFNASFYFKDHRTAYEEVWHSDPRLSDFRRSKIMMQLLKAMEMELSKMGGMPFKLGTSTNPKYSAISEYVAKMGYEKAEEWFFKEIPPWAK